MEEHGSGFRMELGFKASTYEEAMEILGWAARQIDWTLDPSVKLRHLCDLHWALEDSEPGDSLDDRLVPLTDGDVGELARLGSLDVKRDLGVRVDWISISSPVSDFYSVPQKISVQVLQGLEGSPKEGMMLVVIEDEDPKPMDGTDEFPWNMGWLREDEYLSLFMERLEGF